LYCEWISPALNLVLVLLQPGNDKAPTKAAQGYWDGRGFSFMTKESIAALLPICFGTCCTQGNEVRLHSHLEEGFSGDYAINKCWQYIIGKGFDWVTDCYAIKLILFYEGGNPAILHLQMHLMCWDVDIVHWLDTELIDANYWSCLGIDLDFDLLFCKYLNLTCELQKSHPAPTNLPMQPENMPYYHRPCF
jgi:hypothetical protein